MMTAIDQHILPEERRPLLRRRLAAGGVLRLMECHNPLSAMVATEATETGPDGRVRRFDGLWLSGFSMAVSRGLPDIELARLEKRLETIEEIAAATDLPLVVDADTGGEPLAFRHLCARLETLGVSAVVVEDKLYPKRTSLADNVAHGLEDAETFVAKIAAARRTVRSSDFMIVARTEALIAGAGMAEAVSRAGLYIRAEVDALLIHSKQSCGAEVLEFAERYRDLCLETGKSKPLFAIPTAYPQFTEEALGEAGISVVIYGNHQIRAAHAAMTDVCRSVLQHGRSLEAGDRISDVRAVMDIVGIGEDSSIVMTAAARAIHVA